MNKKQRFTAVIENAGGGGAYVNIPFDVEQVFGKKRVKVKAVIGGVPYRGTLVRMGGPCHMLPVLKSIREQAGRNVGDEIDIVLEEDTELRAITPPEDLARALAQQPDAAAFFEKLSYTHQREYVMWIEEAKRDATRATRIERTIALLLEGKRGR